MPRDDRPKRFVAVIRHDEDRSFFRTLLVPAGQSLDMDDREWLRSYLGREWHLVAFSELESG